MPSELGVGELSLRVREHFDGQILSTLMLRLNRPLVLHTVLCDGYELGARTRNVREFANLTHL